jgi:hypothetical protein
VHVNDVRLQLADEAAQREDRREVELVTHRQAGEAHAALGGASSQRGVGAADDRHVVAALAESGCGLIHLVYRAGVELVELEHLEDAHGAR